MTDLEALEMAAAIADGVVSERVTLDNKRSSDPVATYMSGAAKVGYRIRLLIVRLKAERNE